MSVRINIEIGHEASIRSKRTVDGFTHDWEVFVRGCDKADIHYFIDKVVFHLHETFPNPKRVIKEPPYSVRESGYAGFNLPIDIYLRTNEEPKKIRFTYDLNLQPTGPAICKVQKEKYVFHSPSDEFRHKLVKGGGYVTNSDPARDISSSTDKLQVLNKAKSAGSSEPVKKHRTKEHKQEDSFTNLFGTPITKTTKVSPDAKMPAKTSPTSVPPLKPDKSSNPKKSKSKHSPKDKDRDKEKKDKGQEKKHKEEKKSKERSKDKERKDKSLKRERSPVQQPSVSPVRSPKRPPSPKRMPSPKRPPSPPAKLKLDDKKPDDLAKDKLKADSKRSKHEPKDKDKEKKEHKSHKEKEAAGGRSAEPPKAEHKAPKEPKPPKEQQQQQLQQQQLPYKAKEKSAKPPDEARDSDKGDKQKADKPPEPEKQKHKHKKRDGKEKRDKREEKSREKRADRRAEKGDTFFEKVYKDEAKGSPREPVSAKPAENSGPEKPPVRDKAGRGLSALQAELVDDTSSSSVVTHDESSVEVPAKPAPAPPPPPPPAPMPLAEKPEPGKKSKDRARPEPSPEKKRKRKHESNGKDETPATRGADEPSPKITRDEPEYVAKQPSGDSGAKREAISSSAVAAAADASQDYMSTLKELQHKIMTLQDNEELQRVVQLIAETGQFEITAQTFDFDLCALDRDTVRRLQEFLARS